MFSKIVTITFAVSFISVTSGFVINAKLRVLEPILKCYETEDTTAVSAFEKAIEKDHKETFADDLKLTCLSMEKYEACLADVIKAKSPPVPIVFYFYAALAYQTTFLLKKANLCPHITYDGLKKITEESGILGKEKLHNIENDKYVKCAGDAVEKCLIHHVDMSASAKEGSGDYAYVKCMKKEAKSCKAVILRHIVDQLEAYKRHLKRLMELEKPEGL